MRNKAKILILGVLTVLPAFFLTPAVLVYADIGSPTVYTYSPDYIGTTAVTAKADVNPNGRNTNIWFEWTYDPNNFYYKTSPQSVGSGQSAITVYADLGPLTPDRLYYYRAVISGNDTTIYGSTVTFRTKSTGGFFGQNSSGILSISARGSQDISQTRATIAADVNPGGFKAYVWFEWGSSVSGLINQTPIQFIGSGSVSMNVLAGLYSLSPDTVYFWRPVAKNDNDVVYGSTFSFRTLSGGATSNFIFGSSFSLPTVSTAQVRGIDPSSAAA